MENLVVTDLVIFELCNDRLTKKIFDELFWLRKPYVTYGYKLNLINTGVNPYRSLITSKACVSFQRDLYLTSFNS